MQAIEAVYGGHKYVRGQKEGGVEDETVGVGNEQQIDYEQLENDIEDF